VTNYALRPFLVTNTHFQIQETRVVQISQFERANHKVSAKIMAEIRTTTFSLINDSEVNHKNFEEVMAEAATINLA
jgi:hypothetical protein